jgi:transposase
MIELTEDMRIMVAVKPAHFRCGIDGLSGVCQSVLHESPRSGIVFVFRNRSATAVKILAYRGRGFWLCHYRLSSGRFPRWPASADDIATIQVLAEELRRLLFDRPSKGGSSLQWQRLAQQGQRPGVAACEAAPVTPASVSQPASADTSRASSAPDVCGWPWHAVAPPPDTQRPAPRLTPRSE